MLSLIHVAQGFASYFLHEWECLAFNLTFQNHHMVPAFPTTTRKEVPAAAAEPFVPPPWEKRGCCSRAGEKEPLAVCAHDITATIHRRAKREGELAGERDRRRPQLPLKGRTV